MPTSNDIKAKQLAILKCPTIRWNEIRVVPPAEFSRYYCRFFNSYHSFSL